jgi:hypothetical protein
MSRIRRVETRKDLERSVDEFITRGYKLQSQGDASARLQEKDWGDSGVHIIIALLTVWWTLGLGNALYAVYKRATAEEIIIRVKGTEPTAAEREDGSGHQTPATDAERERTQSGGADSWAIDSEPRGDSGSQSHSDHQPGVESRSPSGGSETNGQRSAEPHPDGQSDRTTEMDPDHRSDGETRERFDDT